MLFLITFILLICLGIWTAQQYGAVLTYMSFAWLVPVAGIIWSNYEFELDLGKFNHPFVQFLIAISFVLSVICLPLILVKNWNYLSVKQILGLAFAAFLQGIPYFIYQLFSIYPPR